MIDKNPDSLSWLSRTLQSAIAYPYATWGGSTAFLAALWSAAKDGKGWCASLFAAILAVVITLSVLAVMRKTGLHEEWMPLVGMLVGFVGADRIRTVVLGAWDARKSKLVDGADNSQQK